MSRCASRSSTRGWARSRERSLSRVRTSHAGPGERGSALVEFCFVTVALLIPLIYLASAVAAVLDNRAAAQAAVREAGRAFVLSDSAAAAHQRARATAEVVMRDRRVMLPRNSFRVTCSGRCLAPGTSVATSISMRVALPMLPGWLNGPALTVTSRAVTPVDRFRGVR